MTNAACHPARPVRDVAACEGGNVVVEFALLLMPMLLIIFGFFEFGRYFFINDSLADAAREAARAAIVRGAASDDPATSAEIAAIVRRKVPTMVERDLLDVSVTYQPNNSPGSKVFVEVTYPIVFFLPGMSGLPAITINKVASMTISR